MEILVYGLIVYSVTVSLALISSYLRYEEITAARDYWRAAAVRLSK